MIILKTIDILFTINYIRFINLNERIKFMSCFFISGHRDITDEEFEKHYIPKIDDAIKNPNNRFVVCDYYGVDIMAQRYLKDKKAKHVIVFHMLSEPRNNIGFPTIGNFQSDIERDSAATDVSDEDIAWVREGKEKSGTAQNLQRRRYPAGTYVKDMSIKRR